MKIQEQVLSIEQMKHLQELGVDTSDASMVWIRKDSIIFPDTMKELWWVDTYYDSLKPMVEQDDSGFVQTYTIGDLIKKLPKSIDISYGEYDLEILIKGEYTEVKYTNDGDYTPFSCSNLPLIESLYSILCWLAKTHKELLDVKK